MVRIPLQMISTARVAPERLPLGERVVKLAIRLGLILALLGGMLGAPEAYGCSLVDPEAAMVEAVELSGTYFFITVAAAAAVAGISLYQRR